MTRRLDYCGVASLLGRRAADLVHGHTFPPGLDMDHIGDQDAATAIATERAAQDSRCAECRHINDCNQIIGGE